ncbi:hypothetical protein AG0111_0g2923 [Alternaria gaisen]|uniref:Uncharacterized protein n=1 Tax=Alternaria gaisen TaxID=167740 RepID=A0ACB6FV32_9PLEO|nr:hypothetical protein AG0111_0g2923 [Alternaria gaisen]
MAIQQRSKQTSIILTFRILQFVKQLRRRVKPRVLDGSIDANALGSRLSPSLRSIANGLSQISVQDAKQSRRVAHRICKSQHKNPELKRSSRKLQTPGSAAPASRNLGDEVQHMLRSVDGKLHAAGNTFSSIAGSNKLFLKHHNTPIFEACSLNETIQILVAVHEAINVLTECRQQYGDDWLLAQGLDAGLILDENFIANYEHLLLRLQTDLIEALAQKAFKELLDGDHDKKQRKLLAWFTEFAEKPQALSTFPWTIKPSLAVLWGVCWMFYEKALDEQTNRNKDRVRYDAVLQNLNLSWDTGASSDYLSLGRELIGEQPQHATHATNVNVGHDLFQARNTETWEPDLSSDGLTSRLPISRVSQAGGAEPSPCPDTYYRPAAQDYQAVSPVNFYLPQDPGIAAPPLTAFPHLGSDHHNSWHPYSLPPQDSPRHLITSTQVPRVRVTGAAESNLFAQPQTDFASSGIYRPNRQPEAQQQCFNPQFFNIYDQNIMTELSPNPTPMQVPHEHKRNISINSLTDMPTPVSMVGPRSPLTSPTAGERPIITTSPPRSHSRGISVDSSQDGDDDGSLRKNHSYKRAEEPPRNEDGKMVCKYQECRGTSFDRKCEWSKHMDKHDRPYKCNVKGCEKLQGFTYSGGLLRHEREVHKMHGGTKKSLFCPFHDCKRSSGAGFTRKENLAEHVRRVHRRTSMSADMHGLIIRRDMVRREMEGSPIAESRASESPYNRPMEYREEEDLSLKRKRVGSDSGISDRGNDEMRSEIKRLRQENEEKDSRLRQLEQAVMALQQSHRQ